MKKVFTYDSFDLFYRKRYKRKQAKTLRDALIVGIMARQYDKSRGKMDGTDSLSNQIKSARDKGVL